MVTLQLVLRQDIVSTPGAEGDSDAVQKDRENEADTVIHVRKLGFESLEGGVVVQGGVLSQGIVVVEVACGLFQQALGAGELEGSGDVELLVIGEVGAF